MHGSASGGLNPRHSHRHHRQIQLRTQLPGSNSGMAPAADAPLFQRRTHRAKSGVEGGADAVDGGDDHEADAGSDQAIFDRGGAGIIIQEF